jgi:hypothetical protein
VDLDRVADELYSLPPEEFTRARIAREKQARAEGDGSLADRIHQLRKPNAVAWLANQLARDRPDEIQPLLDLGAGLREATADLHGDQLRELGKQQHQVIYALVQQAKRLANGAGHKVSADTARGLEDTLHAALVDDTAAEQLTAGRLTGPLHRTGLAETDADNPPPSRRSSTARRSATASDGQQGTSQLARAKEDEEQARTAANETHTAREQAAQNLADATRSAEKAAAEVTRLQSALDDATAEHSRAERQQRTRRTDLGKADRAARNAQRRLDDATQRRRRLTDK